MATTIKWIDNNTIETAHRIYKSSTYFTKDNIPAPLVELGPDITEYVDSAGVDGENWYIVSALLNGYEVFSEPFIAGLSTAYIHDVFDDGSAVATYQFDGDATDLGGTYDWAWGGTATYTSGVIEQSVNFDGTNYLEQSSKTLENRTISLWVNTSSSSEQQYISFRGNNRILSSTLFSTNNGTAEIATSSWVIGDTNSAVNIISNQTALNVWVHVCIVLNSVEEMEIMYVNGVPVNTPSTTKSRADINETQWRIGIRSNAGGYAFTGMIDQLRIFNRPLTQAEVDILYQEGADFL